MKKTMPTNQQHIITPAPTVMCQRLFDIHNPYQHYYFFCLYDAFSVYQNGKMV